MNSALTSLTSQISAVIYVFPRIWLGSIKEHSSHFVKRPGVSQEGGYTEDAEEEKPPLLTHLQLVV